MVFVEIPAGTFLMGTPEDAEVRGPNETQHEVTLAHPFEITTTEVTNQQFILMAELAVERGWAIATDMALIDNLDGSSMELYDLDDKDREIDYNGSEFICILPDNPVQELTWYGAVAYCDWMSMYQELPRAYDHDTWLCNENSPYTATGYRLPTEAEWEYACRAETTTDFANGPITNRLCDDPRLDLIGWYCGNGGEHNHAVAEKIPNAWGLYDMHGNLWEWCNDPVGSTTGTYAVVRGGGWDFGAVDCRSAAREGEPRTYATNTISFRMVKTVQ